MQKAELPELPLPLVDGRLIRVLVETKEAVPTPASTTPAPTDASHLGFGDDDAHHPRFVAFDGIPTLPSLLPLTLISPLCHYSFP